MTDEELKDFPSMDDYTEDSSLIIVEEEDKKKAESTEGETDEEKETREAEEAEAKQKEENDAEEARLKKEKEEEEEEAAEEEKKTPEEKKKTSEEEEDDEAGDFYETVKNIHGIEIEVEYGEADPLSAEGVAKRESTLAKTAIESQMIYLEETFPKEYKLLQHAMNGGAIDDIITPNYIDYSKIELEEENTDQHKAFLKTFYMDKGLSEKKAEGLVEADEDGDGTYKAAQDALKERQELQKGEETKALKKREEIADKQKERDQSMVSAVQEISESGKIANLQIPKAEQKKFQEFALSNIRRSGEDSYSLVVPITEKNIEAVMQQTYFAYKGGDLSKLIEVEANKKSVTRLKTKLKEKKKAESAAAEERKPEKTVESMQDFNTE